MRTLAPGFLLSPYLQGHSRCHSERSARQRAERRTCFSNPRPRARAPKPPHSAFAKASCRSDEASRLVRGPWTRDDACCDERSVLLCLREHENVVPRLELVGSGGQSGHADIAWNADRLHPTAVLNGEGRCPGLGADRSIGHARGRISYGAIGHSAATRTLPCIRIHQIASLADAAQLFGEDVDVRRTLRTVGLFDRSDTHKRFAVDVTQIGRSPLVHLQGAAELNRHGTGL